MSSYYSSQDSYDDDDEMPMHSLFDYDYYLSGSIEQITQWSENYRSQDLYSSLQKQYNNTISKPENLIKTIGQIRYIHFVSTLQKTFQALYQDYRKLYDQWGRQKTSIEHIIITPEQNEIHRSLNQKFKKLLEYLEFVQGSNNLLNFKKFQDQIDQNDSKICQTLAKLFPMLSDLQAEWGLSQMVHVYKESLRHKVIRGHFGMSLNQHLNTLQNLSYRHSQLIQYCQMFRKSYENKKIIDQKILIAKLIQNVNIQQRDINEFFIAVKGIRMQVNPEKNQQTTQAKIQIFDLMLFNQKSPQSGINKFKAQFQGQEHQRLWIQAFEQSFNNKELLNTMLTYAQPGIMMKDKKNKNSQKINSIEEKQKGLQQILFQQLQMVINTLREQNPVNGVNPYLFKKINYALLVQFLSAFQEFSRQIFYREDQGDTSIYQRYVQTLKYLKDLFLSFAEDVWIAPFDIFIPLTLKFFDSMSEDLKGDVKQILYKMVGNLNEDKLPKKAVLKLKQGVDLQKSNKKSKMGIINDWQVVLEPVSRLQYLQVIFYYMYQVGRNGEFVHFPDIVPSNTETGILFVKSLKLRLQHHKPTTEQQPYFKLLLDQCQKLKLTTNFKWYQPSKKGLEQKQIEFNIERSLPQTNRIYFRKALNMRDQQTYQKLSQNKTQITEIIDLLKYNRGMDTTSVSPQFDQMELFSIIQTMRNFLSFDFDIFNMAIEEQVNLNLVHLSLGFYSIKQKQAQGSQIYELLLHKFMIPFMLDMKHLDKQKQLRRNFPNFFEPWVYRYLIVEVGSIIFGLLESFQNTKEWQQIMVSKFQMYKNLFTGLQSNHLVPEKVQEFISCFVSFLQPKMPIKVYMQVCQVLVQLQKILPSIKQFFSMQVVLNEELLVNKQFIDFMFATDNQGGKNKNTVSKALMYEFIKSLDQYVLKGLISPANTFSMIEKYKKSQKNTNDTSNYNQNSDINQFIGKIKEDQKRPFTILLKAMKSLETKFEDRDIMHTMFKQPNQKQQQKMQLDGVLGHSWATIEQFLNDQTRKQSMSQLRGIKFCKLAIIDKVISEFQQKENFQAKKIFQKVIMNYGDAQDLIFFAHRLSNLQILKGNETVYEKLIVEDYEKQIQTEILKKILSNTEVEHLNEFQKIKSCAQNVVKEFSDPNNKKKLQVTHLSRLIMINQKYASKVIQEFILKNIGGHMRINAKITQPFLVTAIKKDLEAIPLNLIERVIFHEQNYRSKVTTVFQKLTYLPVQHLNAYLTNQSIQKMLKNNIKQNIQREEDHEGQWQTDSENDYQENELEDKQNKQQTTTAKKEESKLSESNTKDYRIFDQQVLVEGEQQISSSSSSSSQSEYDSYDRPEFLDCFTNQPGNGQLSEYKRYIQLREQIDIYVKNNFKENYNSQAFTELSKQGQGYLKDKVLQIVKILNNMSPNFAKTIVNSIPDQIFNLLRFQYFGLTVKRQSLKRKKASIKEMKFQQNIFSGRQQSQQSDALSEQDDHQQEYDDQQYCDDYEGQGEDMSDQDDMLAIAIKKSKQQMQQRSQNQKFKQQDLIQDIKANSKMVNNKPIKTAFSNQQIVKIMEVMLYQCLFLSASVLRQQAITNLYKQLIHCKDVGKIFVESLLTILRIDENADRFNNFVHKIIENNSDSSLPDMDKATLNAIYILKEAEQSSKTMSKVNGKYRSFLQPSETLLPIGHFMFQKFQLAIQDNLITIALLYIRKDSQIRSRIEEMNVVPEKSEKDKKQDQFLSKKKDLNRVIKQMYVHNCPARAWHIFKDNFGFRFRGFTNLINGLEIYSKQLNPQITNLMKKIYQIESNLKSKNVMADQSDISALRVLKRKSTDESGYHNFLASKLTLQNQFHIYSNLIHSYKAKVKLFYFMNKFNLQNKAQDPDSGQIKLERIRKMPVQMKNRILGNQNLLDIVQMMYFLVDFLRNKFHGKVEENKFSKLVHIPKTIIKTSLMILYCLLPIEKWRSQNQLPIQQFFKKNRYGDFKFSSLQQISQLFFQFLGIESFCDKKFKQMMIPYLIKNPQMGNSVPLIFKAPNVQQDIEGQRFLVTRQCSFDMAFYQLKTKPFLVEYFGEQGSDHGGMVREFMMGWKGVGVGQQSFFMGKLLGISFKQGIPFGGYFDYSMSIAITQSKPTLELLQQVDHKLYSTLKYYQENSVQNCDLTFVVSKQIYGKIFMFQLIPNGSNVDVTQQNKTQYIQKYVEGYWYWGKHFDAQQLRQGFYSIVPQQYARIFLPNELMRKIKGQQVIDCNKLKQKAKYEDGYTSQSPIIVWLWQILQKYNQQQMNKFIQFLTGSPKVSLFHSNFEFTIEKVFDTARLPVAHTCFNTLDLPQYSSKEVLDSKLLLAIFQGNDNFGIL